MGCRFPPLWLLQRQQVRHEVQFSAKVLGSQATISFCNDLGHVSSDHKVGGMGN
jgi:hypothetical protein